MSKPGRPAPDTHDFDREFRAQLSQMTAGIAPTAFTTAWADWAMHLAQSPSRRAALRKQALERAQDTRQGRYRAVTRLAIRRGLIDSRRVDSRRGTPGQEPRRYGSYVRAASTIAASSSGRVPEWKALLEASM